MNLRLIMVYKSLMFYILVVLLIFSQNTKSEVSIPDGFYLDSSEMKMLDHRTSHFVITAADLNYIENFVDDFFRTDYQKKQPKINGNLYLFKNVLEKMQLPDKYITLINRYAVAVSAYDLDKLNRSFVKDVIWWSEARMLKNTKEFDLFISNQVTSDRWKDALKLLIEKGMTDKIISYSEFIENQDTRDSILELSIRQSKLINILKKKDKGFVDELINEIQVSISDVIPIIRKERGAKRHEHLYWLIKQLGVNKTNPEINKMLRNIINDDLYYSQNIYMHKKFQNISNKSLEDIHLSIEQSLDLSFRAKQALNQRLILKYEIRE